MMPNVERLEAVMQFILDHPELHNQAKYTCGTSACFAGHATWMFADEEGWRKLWMDYSSSVGGEVWTKKRNAELGDEGLALRNTHILAQELLGLEDNEACDLFYACNTVDDLQRIVKEYANAQEARHGKH